MSASIISFVLIVTGISISITLKKYFK
jgi:hypothetical protein